MTLTDTFRLTARWLPFAALTGLAAAAGLGLVREATWTRPMPPMPAIGEAPPPTALMIVARDTLVGPVETAHYAVIAIRNLFSASRGEQAEAVATPTASGPRLFLHGVVVDGPSSRAYIEDPDTQRVFGYALGDAVGGGKLVRILDDRVVIRRPDGLMEIMLRDPAKPQPAPAVVPTGPVAPEPAAPTPATPGAPMPAAPGVPAPAQGAEIQPPVTPPRGPR